MGFKATTKVDMSVFNKLKSQIKNTDIDVGYINSPNHWWAQKHGHYWPIAALATDLHYYSPWQDTFMLTPTRYAEINSTVHWVLNQSFGKIPFILVCNRIGSELSDDLKENIREVNSPANSEQWASYKGFNDPLIFGSEYGNTPNLISEVTFKVG